MHTVLYIVMFAVVARSIRDESGFGSEADGVSVDCIFIIITAEREHQQMTTTA